MTPAFSLEKLTRSESIFNSYSRLKKFYSAQRPIILLAFLWLLAALLVNPYGEFPLNDDWAFAKTVKILDEQLRLEMSEWPALSLIAHLAWGWLVSSLFGFSFTALRISVVVLGLAGVLMVWQTLRELGGDGEKALLGALAIGFNAIYFNLSFTFMTDVPFFFCAMISMYCFMRSLRGDKLLMLALGTLAAAAAVLIRQLGLFLPVGYALAVVVKERCALKAWLRGSGAVIFVYGALIAYERWLEVTIGLPAVYRTYEAEVWQKISAGLIPLIRNTADTMLVCLIYLGLFMFPLMLLGLPWRSRRDKIIMIVLTFAGLALACWVFSEGRKLPLLVRGIFTDFVLGPPTLRDVFKMQRENLYRAPSFLLWGITLCGCVGAAWLLRPFLTSVREGLLWLFKGRGDGFRAVVQILGLSSALMILLPLAIKMPLDRYLLACVPGLIIGVAVSGAFGAPLLRWQRRAAALFILGSAVFAVAGTHDYLAWNRARWQALDYLCQELKMPVTNIDGGFEFNGWHLFDPDYQSDDGQKTWWWVQDDEFTVTFGLLENHRVIKSFPYPRWCPPRRDFIYILELSDINADNILLAATRRHGGRNVKTRDGNILRYWDGRRGPLLVAHGSFVCLQPGNYHARFKFAAGRPGKRIYDSSGIFRVVNHDGGAILSETAIASSGQGRYRFITQELPFTVPAEMRVGVQVTGADMPLWLDSVRFIKYDLRLPTGSAEEAKR